jgi:hypothetical protein
MTPDSEQYDDVDTDTLCLYISILLALNITQAITEQVRYLMPFSYHHEHSLLLQTQFDVISAFVANLVCLGFLRPTLLTSAAADISK